MVPEVRVGEGTAFCQVIPVRNQCEAGNQRAVWKIGQKMRQIVFHRIGQIGMIVLAAECGQPGKPGLLFLGE